MCVLCCHKFANMDKLRQHEKLLTLHIENFAKKAAASVPIASSLNEKKEEEWGNFGS